MQSRTEQQRAGRIVSRAFALLATDTSGGAIIPLGIHSRACSGMTVRLAVQKSHCRLTIIGPERHGATDQTLFDGFGHGGWTV